MNNKSIMRNFIRIINDTGLMTKFIMNIFDYNNLNDYNYIFRFISHDKEIIIDIYDNISNNRFNRYIFSFLECNYDMKTVEENGIFVSYICVLNATDSNDKLLKLAYLFSLDKSRMIEYASSFLDNIFVEILIKIIK